MKTTKARPRKRKAWGREGAATATRVGVALGALVEVCGGEVWTCPLHTVEGECSVDVPAVALALGSTWPCGTLNENSAIPIAIAASAARSTAVSATTRVRRREEPGRDAGADRGVAWDDGAGRGAVAVGAAVAVLSTDLVGACGSPGPYGVRRSWAQKRHGPAASGGPVKAAPAAGFLTRTALSWILAAPPPGEPVIAAAETVAINSPRGSPLAAYAAAARWNSGRAAAGSRRASSSASSNASSASNRGGRSRLVTYDA